MASSTRCWRRRSSRRRTDPEGNRQIRFIPRSFLLRCSGLKAGSTVALSANRSKRFERISKVGAHSPTKMPKRSACACSSTLSLPRYHQIKIERRIENIPAWRKIELRRRHICGFMERSMRPNHRRGCADFAFLKAIFDPRAIGEKGWTPFPHRSSLPVRVPAGRMFHPEEATVFPVSPRLISRDYHLENPCARCSR
jgi:hypothetical protein